MNTVPPSLSKLRHRLDRLVSERKLAVRQVNEEKEALKNAKLLHDRSAEARGHLQKVAKLVQAQAHKQLGAVVSKCLSAVFSAKIELRIEFELKRGRSLPRFVYYKHGRRLDPRVDSGGVFEVAALALRIANLVMAEPRSRRLAVPDEPFRGLDRRNLPKMAGLVEMLCKELDFQFLIATHDAALECGRVIELTG